jgi:hypothetical protein
MIGVHWDISWHRSIGRDTFWSPPHVAIYLGGVLAGISSGFLILTTTFGSGRSREAAVRMWGLRGPLGAFVAAWGGVAMLTSAPFDNWWHNAYGLDVKILSPPHVVLALGMHAVALGAWILTLGAMNRAAQGVLRRKLHRLFLYLGGVILVFLLVLSMENLFRLYMHSAAFYRTVALAVPVTLAAVSRATGDRWAATQTALVYTGVLLGLLWILPLFPAEPKLGPVYQKVTRFVPPEFPLLLLFPAAALDLLWARTGARRGPWFLSAVSGLLFLAVYVAVQWPFASFLMSPGARNRIFGAIYFDYNLRPTSFYYRHLFYPLEETAGQFWLGMAVALAAAIVTTRVGIAWGDWMRRVRR